MTTSSFIHRWVAGAALFLFANCFAVAQPVWERKNFTATTEKDSVRLTKVHLSKYCGEYLPASSDAKMTYMYVVLYGELLYRHVNNDYVLLNPVSANKFVYDDNSGRSLEFVTDKEGKVTEAIVTRPDGTFSMKRNLSAAPQPSVALPEGKTKRIAHLMEKYAEYGQFSGSVLVAEHGKVIYKSGFNLANREWRIHNEPDTKHRLGSITKQFTAMLVLQLVEQGKLKLDVPISTYLPDYPKEQGGKITLHHLLTHSSGIPNYTSFPDYQKMMGRSYTPAELVKGFADLPLEFNPGEKFSYSNSGYTLLGYIIEAVSGKTYEQCLQDQILTPLKMTETGYDHHETVMEKRAAGYNKNGNSYTNARYIDMSVPFAAGALYSTVDDLYLWDQALYTDILLPEKSKELLFKKHIPAGPSYYGYGWSVFHRSVNMKESLMITEHSGSINGFNTLISRIPSDKNLVVLLNNTGGAALNEMNYAIRAILYDQPYDLPKRSLAYILADVIGKQGLAEGLAKFKEFKSSGQYVMKEDEINSVGYDFLNAGKITEAIEVFKLNVEAFPASGNCYDSLGEAYLKNGNKELAIKNYKRSVELDPRNENGKKVLAEISK
jgi:CubicO group peptidase (beta-lactamase class C family)